MASKDRARKAKNESSLAVSLLIESLKFISVAQRKEGTPYQVHCAFYANRIAATDGIISAGCASNEDLTLCPNTLKLLAALSKCLSQSRMRSAKVYPHRSAVWLVRQAAR